MFYYLRGRVEAIEPYLAVIDCAGVGFACHTTMRTLACLNKGDEVKLFTHCNIREDAFDIFGFFTRQELNTFRLLIGITGVGPKAAISILSSSSPEDLAVAVVSGNEKALTVAPGIGKKLAQRIMLELHDKLGDDINQLARSGFVANGTQASGSTKKAAEVTAALSALGYAPAEITAAMRGMDIAESTVEEIIKVILKNSLK